MKKIPHVMADIKEGVQKVFLYHVSSVTIVLLIVMGGVAGGVLLFFAYSTPVPDANTIPIVSGNVSVATSVVDGISQYASNKQQSAAHGPLVPVKVFFVPPAR